MTDTGHLRRRMNVLKGVELRDDDPLTRREPTDAETDTAFQVWALLEGRNPAKTAIRLTKDYPDVVWTEAGIKTWSLAGDWRNRADKLFHLLGDAMLREDINNLLALRPKAIDILGDGLNGLLPVKLAYQQLQAAREVLNRSGIQERLTEPRRPMSPPMTDLPEDDATQIAITSHGDRIRRLREQKQDPANRTVGIVPRATQTIPTGTQNP